MTILLAFDHPAWDGDMTEIADSVLVPVIDQNVILGASMGVAATARPIA